LPVPPGGEIFITAPRLLGYFGCETATRGVARLMTLNETVSCEQSSDPPSVSLRLPTTLPAGRHVLSVPGVTALYEPQPDENLFTMYLKDAGGSNVEVALGIIGESVIQGLRINVWPIWWSQARSYDVTVQVTVPLEVLNDADVPVTGFLVVPPLDPLLRLDTAGGAEVETSVGESLPVSTIGRQEDSLLVTLEEGYTLKRGLHLVRFSIVVPENASSFNLWRVALCDGAACELRGPEEPRYEQRGLGVMAVFALPGFDPADSSPGTLPRKVVVAGHAAPAWRRGAAAALLFAWTLPAAFGALGRA